MPRSRLVSVVVLAVVIALVAIVTFEQHRSKSTARAASDQPASSSRSTQPTAPPTTAKPTTTTTSTIPHDPARTFTLTHVKTIAGHISPKSVTATGTGMVTAQNMMYTHTMTVYDKDGNLVKTIDDGVDLAKFNIPGHPGISKGAPVEAAVDSAHKYVFTSNYSMYGANFGPEGNDNCGGPSGLSPSYVYRVKLASLAIEALG